MIDPEQELINHCADPSSVERLIKEDLSLDLLVRPQTKSVLRFVQSYFNKSNLFPTEEVLVTQFPEVEFEPISSSIDWVLDTIRLRYQRGELYDLTIQLSELHGEDKISEAMELLRTSSTEIERKSLSNTHSWSIDDIPLFITKLQDEVLNSNNYQSFTLGFKEIDSFTGGYRPGHLLFLAARPKRQKSFVQIKTFLEQVKQGKNPVLFTLELTHREVMLRLMCMITGYPWDRAQRGDFGLPGAWKMLQNGWTDFREKYNGAGHIIQPEDRSVASLILQAERLQADSIFISQLKYVKPVKNYRNPYDAHAEVVHDLKLAASRPGKEIPIHVEAQLNREAQNIHELQELDLAQLGLTDAIGQVADAVYAITQGEGERNMSVLEYGILEARNHGKKSWWIKYDYLSNCKLDMFGEVNRTP